MTINSQMLTHLSNQPINLARQNLSINSYADKKWCAPGRTFHNGTCYLDEELRTLAQQYNRLNPKKRIDTRQSAGAIHKELRERLKMCNNEYCWLSTPIMKRMPQEKRKEFQWFIFNPPKPAKKYQWFNTSEISDKLRQYMRIYPDFKSFGALPLDFERHLGITPSSIWKLLGQGKRRFGMVVNMDKHTQPGSHWTGLWIDIRGRAGYIEYFDSFAVPPPALIKRFIKGLVKGAKQRGIQMRYKQNTLQHQKGDSECGMYSMYFIISKLNGMELREAIPDETMNGYRDVYFRPSIK